MTTSTPTSPTSGAKGIPAIIPHASSKGSGLAFTAVDVTQYSRSNALPHARTEGKVNVVAVHFMTSKAASALLAGEPTGLGDDQLVAIAEVHGTFTFTTPQTQGTAHRAFEVFDGTTGNLLMLSVLG
jgi:hypothetical protein